MILIASSLSLLAIVAGMFLYAKTIKDQLNRLFKIVSFFIIIVGFLNLFAGSAFYIMKKIYRFGIHHRNMEMGIYVPHGNKMKWQKHKHKHMSCEGMNKRACEYFMKAMNCDEMEQMDDDESYSSMARMKRDKSCCLKEKMMMKKDSVMIKK